MRFPAPDIHESWSSDRKYRPQSLSTRSEVHFRINSTSTPRPAHWQLLSGLGAFSRLVPASFTFYVNVAALTPRPNPAILIRDPMTLQKLCFGPSTSSASNKVYLGGIFRARLTLHRTISSPAPLFPIPRLRVS